MLMWCICLGLVCGVLGVARVVWIIRIYHCPGVWKLLPWIATNEFGWGFSWLFLYFARVSVPDHG